MTAKPPLESAQEPGVVVPPLDTDKERERLEPGLNTAGKGDTGTRIGPVKGDENSNT